MTVSTPTAAEAVALLRAGPREYMAHADLGLVRRVGAVAYAVTGLFALGILPFVAPTALVGAAAGWTTAALFVLGSFGAALATMRARRTRLDAIYVADVALVIGLGLLGWLARDGDLYSALPLPIAIVAAATFPPARVFALMAIAYAAQVPALLEIGADVNSCVELVVHTVMCLCLGTLALLWTAGVRVQRRMLHANAHVDVLTGLGNRRAFDQAAATEVARAVRSGRPLSLLVADLDHFKEINDRHGHLAGDACLRHVAAVVRDLTRRPDACFRWGGDEFVVLLWDVDAERARTIASRLAEAVRERCQDPDGRGIGMAFGVAEREGDLDAAAILARADADLLRAKDADPATTG